LDPSRRCCTRWGAGPYWRFQNSHVVLPRFILCVHIFLLPLPLQGSEWDESSFSWLETVYTFRQHGYSTDYLIDFSIVTDSKNSSWRVIDIDQASLGMSREYLINGMADDDVNSYYNYMVNVAVLLGADR
jgi:hypothetical protein